MPINIFGNSSNNSEQKIDKNQFVQKHCPRTTYIESNFEEDINLKINVELKIYLIQLAYVKPLQKNMLIIN